MLIFDAIKRTGLNFQSRVAWVVSHGLTPKKRLSGRYETAPIFSKGEPSVFNPAPARTPQKPPNNRSYKRPHKGKLSGHPQGARPSNVWNIPTIGQARTAIRERKNVSARVDPRRHGSIKKKKNHKTKG